MTDDFEGICRGEKEMMVVTMRRSRIVFGSGDDVVATTVRFNS